MYGMGEGVYMGGGHKHVHVVFVLRWKGGGNNIVNNNSY